MLVTVTLRVDGVPTLTLPKASEVGETLATGRPVAFAVPVRPTTTAAPEAGVTVTVADFGPVG